MRVVEEKDEFDCKIVKTYNDSNRLVKQETYNKVLGFFSKVQYTEHFFYDDKSNLIRTLFYMGKDKLHWEKKHFYDDNDLNIKDIQIDHPSGSEGFVEYEYDKNGYKIAEQGELANGHKYRNEWGVDDEGNRIPLSKKHTTLG